MGQPPDRETWRSLLVRALRIIDGHEASYGTLDVRFGGGTVLMLRFDHRISKDIDLFIDDVQALSFLSPRLNDAVAAETDEYVEQANSLKLVFPEGDVDIIASATVIPNAAPDMLDVSGRIIAVDATAEILAKKLLYRAESLKPRDVIDMAAALALDPVSAQTAIAATRSVHPALLRRLALLRTADPKMLARDPLLTETGRVFVDGMVDRLIAALDQDRSAT